ncbi:PAS domain-containing protein [Micromonospora sp. STR1s_5]|nr:PAS domain-containing protein [Micromonospora sp. STR1s_5]
MNNADGIRMITLFEGEFATEDTLRFIEEKGGIGLWAWDLNTDEMVWSPGVFALADLEIGRTKPSYDVFISLIHPDDRLSQSEVERLIGAGLPLLRNFRLITRNGRIRWITNDSEVLFDGAGKPSRVIGALFDVTRQHDAILATRAAEERYRAMVQASGLVAWTSTPGRDWGRSGVAPVLCADARGRDAGRLARRSGSRGARGGRGRLA